MNVLLRPWTRLSPIRHLHIGNPADMRVLIAGAPSDSQLWRTESHQGQTPVIFS